MSTYLLTAVSGRRQSAASRQSARRAPAARSPSSPRVTRGLCSPWTTSTTSAYRTRSSTSSSTCSVAAAHRQLRQHHYRRRQRQQHCCRRRRRRPQSGSRKSGSKLRSGSSHLRRPNMPTCSTISTLLGRSHRRLRLVRLRQHCLPMRGMRHWTCSGCERSWIRRSDSGKRHWATTSGWRASGRSSVPSWSRPRRAECMSGSSCSSSGRSWTASVLRGTRSMTPR